ncbi:hypothetical protein EPUS_01250 [Endocarpon pusillum Z07020]|uniref:Xylanolytic transcriptional activator regulatory domain-containing protein n=1 Tax=Endocarpon pusillum (strain Z07020 / HMAS-L-300199) TaxID=1263415 RepID=U1I1R9_ENDPU|nr:uncharacterized protein EPUS_01250 [Endocarpon pusillum Z07020]ERF75884.1 hypothetical protein EPUS_01250 [Endocarpon pusillum Z07020]
MSNNGWPQTAAHERLSRPHSEHGPSMRLPGVRQLLQPDVFVGPDPSTLTPQHHPEQPRSILPTTTLSSAHDFLSLSKRASESSIKGLQSDPFESMTSSPPSMRTSSSDALIPIHHQTPTFMQAPPQQSRDALSNRNRERGPQPNSALCVISPDLISTGANSADGSDQNEPKHQPTSRRMTAEKHQTITYPASSAAPDYGEKVMKRPEQRVDSRQDWRETMKSPPGRLRSSDASSPILDSPPVFDMMEKLGLQAADWNLDPYPISPVTKGYLDLYFAHVNQGIYYIFPKGPFLTWVGDRREKTLDDKMLLYAMISMGCSFSTHKESVVHGKRMLQLARYAEQNSVGRFTLQLVQTRWILSLLKFSLGDFSEASDYCGAAARGVCELKFNTEYGVVERLNTHGCEYGLDRRTMAECQRRTFWSVYLLERCNGLCSGLPPMLQNEDCFIRVPCSEELYENQDIPVTPLFGTIDQNVSWPKPASLGTMSYLIVISSIWGQVLQYLYREKHRTFESDDDKYEKFYSGKQRQLRRFIDRLPPHLFACNTQNIQQALQEGYAETFILLHARYHTVLMKLNRHAPHREMDESSLSRNIRAAQFHARELLKFTLLLSKVYEEQRSSKPARTFSVPFQAYSMLSAVDILTSIGTLADLKSDLQLVQSSYEVVQKLSKYWASAQKQLKVIALRFEEIMKALQCAPREYAFFVTADAMEDLFGKDLDLFFAPTVEERFAALGFPLTISNESGVLRINSLDSDNGCCGIRKEPKS